MWSLEGVRDVREGGGGGDVRKNKAPEHVADGPAKKPRKPYTKTKPRVSWTPKEHARFLKALGCIIAIGSE